MNRNIDELTRAIIARYELKIIEDVLRIIPLHMCHITQEPEVFKTWPANLVRLTYPRVEWPEHEAVYARYRDEVIPSLSLGDYLGAFVEPVRPRLPCFCTEMSDVAGTLVSALLAQPVYAIRKIYVNYLYLPQPWHSLNALVTDGRIRYFDSSAYRQVFDKSRRKFVRPDQLPGFNKADVEPRFLVSDNWLQSEPFARTISLRGEALKDSFYPNPLDSGNPDEYLRIYGQERRPEPELRNDASLTRMTAQGNAP
ncbi:hypothetical protein [Paraburkholderia sp.]|uniref:hypothetical protein n=1 Tax=Paraburkholderia sp. TaxID=1926495 RepID=UPI002610AE3E|nr:hypothetical protein [Paraburkholderia sp.]